MTKIQDRSKIFLKSDPIATALFDSCQIQVDYFSSLIDQLQNQSQGKENFSSWYLKNLAKNIANLRRIGKETDENYRDRLFAITKRKKVQKWNTEKAGRAFLSYHYPRAKIFSEYGVINKNLIKSGDFEDLTATDWSMQNASLKGTEDKISSFKGFKSLVISQGGHCQQIISNVENGHYVLRFAYNNGNIRISILQNSKYWNSQANIVNGLPQGAWLDSNHYTELASTEDWQYRSLFFRVDTVADIKIKISCATDKEAHLDDIQLGQYHSPSLQYHIRLNANNLIPDELSSYLNLWSGPFINNGTNQTGAFIDHTYNIGLDRHKIYTQQKQWLKIIAAAGVYIRLHIFSGIDYTEN